ncbi:MAG: hypothetical protein R3233_09445, partial [Xanthomonadales bacterium]|nr:hypothetical protein [Xanthomonadales bacterium]
MAMLKCSVQHRLAADVAVDPDRLAGQAQVGAQQQAQVETAGEPQLTGRERRGVVGADVAVQRAAQRPGELAEVQVPGVDDAVRRQFQRVERNFAGPEVPRAGVEFPVEGFHLGISGPSRRGRVPHTPP